MSRFSSQSGNHGANCPGVESSPPAAQSSIAKPPAAKHAFGQHPVTVPNWWRALRWCLLSASLLVTGCQGCWTNKEITDKPEKEKPKERFVVENATTLPADDKTIAGTFKPGHLGVFRQTVTANRSDFPGLLHSEVQTKFGTAATVPYTAFRTGNVRSVDLVEGNKKALESYFFPPVDTSKTSTLFCSLRTTANVPVIEKTTVLKKMPANQYYLVVLTTERDRFSFLNGLYSTRTLGDEFEKPSQQLYQVRIPDTENTIALPSNPLAWTSTAYLIWDRFDANKLSTEQQRSLIDWLHWGGQLIVNGPASLTDLERKSCFLSPYLPARSDGDRKLVPKDLLALNQNWSLTDAKDVAQDLKLAPGRDYLGIRLKPYGDGRFISSTGDLVSVGRVGRGRIVVTSLNFAEPWVVRWGSFDGFVNGVLLGRPGRTFSARTPYFRLRDYPLLRDSPLLTTGVRYLARDLHRQGDTDVPQTAWEETGNAPDRRTAGFGTGDEEESMASWHDKGRVAAAAQQMLRQASGIEVPDLSLVFQILLGYLVILVPVNWCFWRLVGRLEWAWVSAPILALIGTYVVVQIAQLDIGFARSQNSVALLELHAGHNRGHLSTFTALYSSLTTPYEVESDNTNTIVQPFAAQTRTILPGRGQVMQSHDNRFQFGGFVVQSSSTDMLRSEEILDTEGSFQLTRNDSGTWQLANDTRLKLRGTGIIRRDDQGQVHAAWIGDCESGSQHQLDWKSTATPWFAAWDDSQDVRSKRRTAREELQKRDVVNKDGRLSASELKWTAGQLRRWDVNESGSLELEEYTRYLFPDAAAGLTLGPMLEAVTYYLPLARGEVRLVGWTDRSYSQLKVTPVSSQRKSLTMVVVHLKMGQLAPPQVDTNLAADFDNRLQLPGVESKDFGQPKPPSAKPNGKPPGRTPPATPATPTESKPTQAKPTQAKPTKTKPTDVPGKQSANGKPPSPQER